MSEVLPLRNVRHPFRNEEIRSDEYQTALRGLMYALIMSAFPNAYASRPTEPEGRQTVEFTPPSKRWDSVGVIVYPQTPTEQAEDNKVLAAAQLCHNLENTNLEYVLEHRVVEVSGVRWLNKTARILDHSHVSIEGVEIPEEEYLLGTGVSTTTIVQSTSKYRRAASVH